MLGWVVDKMKAAREQSVQLAAEDRARELAIADIKAKVESRFRGRVFFVPKEMVNLKKPEVRAWYDDEDWEKWQRILDQFPDAPRGQSEALANEERFWRFFSEFCTLTDSSGQPDLGTRADLANFYYENERWILRRYFAATGKNIDPAVKEETRLILERTAVNPRRIPKSEADTAWRHREAERLNRDIESFINRGAKEHYEKWGKWFAANVEDCFKRMHKPARQEPDNTHGEGGFASAEDIDRLRAQARGSAVPTAHQQNFKD